MHFFSYFSSQGFSNCYIIGPEKGGDAIIIDPGIFDVELLKLIENNNLYIKSILVTHCHDDHINGIKTILRIYDSTIYSFRNTLLDYPCVQVKDGHRLNLGEFNFEVLETPGHSGDSVCYKLGNYLFTGDTLLAGSIGYTIDAFSRSLIYTSLKDKIFTLNDNTFIFPGHGPPSRIGVERNLNPDLKD